MLLHKTQLAVTTCKSTAFNVSGLLRVVAQEISDATRRIGYQTDAEQS